MSLKAPKRVRRTPPPNFMRGGRSELLVLLYGGTIHPPGHIAPYDPALDPEMRMKELTQMIVDKRGIC